MTSRVEEIAESMSMAAGPSDPDDEKLSWREREMVAALKRLANAQLQVALIEAQAPDASGAVVPPGLDPADVDELEEIRGQLPKLTKKAKSLLAGGSARAKIVELEARQQQVLDRLGFVSYDDYEAAQGSDAPDPSPEPAIDPVVELFARRELAAAEAAYREVLDLPDDAEPIDGRGPGGGSPTTIDLTGT